MDFFFTLYLFIIGAVIGSFLNVCIYRIPKKISIITPPSNCPSCNTGISPKDNIPILSYLFLKGKCRHCGAKISFRYLIVEFISALSLSAFYLIFGFKMIFFQVSLLFYILLVLSWIDAEEGIVSLEIVIFGTIVGLFLLILEKGSNILPNIIGAAVGFLLVLISYFIGRLLFRKDTIGGGDLYLTTMLGLYLGWQKIITAYFLAFLIAAVFLVLLALKLKKIPKDQPIPLVPFLSIGGILGLTIGDKINNFYLNSFFM